MTEHNLHPSLVVFLCWTLPSICHWTYFHTSKGHVTWIIKKVNRIPTLCGMAYEVSPHLLEVTWLECTPPPCSTQNVFWIQTLDISALSLNVQEYIPIIKKITPILKSKLISLSGEIYSNLIFHFIDQSQPSNIAMTRLNLMPHMPSIGDLQDYKLHAWM